MTCTPWLPGFLPYDAELVDQPTANLQHFRSKQFEDVMPDELLADSADPGDIFVRFNLREGRSEFRSG